MKLLIALLVVATVMDLSLSTSFSRNRRSSAAAVPRFSVQQNADILDKFLTKTFPPPTTLRLQSRGSLSGGWSSTPRQVPGGNTAFKVVENMHDVLLVLDSSASIGPGEFLKAKQFMTNVVNLLPSIVSRNNTRIACISFSEAHKIITEFGFLTHTSKSSVIQAINRIKYHHGGSTHTTKALQMAKTLFETTGRPGARKVLILATDGQSNGGGDPAVPANQMKNGLGVTIFVAAVSKVNVAVAIVSPPGHVRAARAARASRPYVIYVDSFNEALRVTGAVRKMQLSRRLNNNPRLAGIHG